MEFEKLIEERYSVRNFKPEKLSKEDISNYKSVWVEPISSDPIRNELRGWYTVRNEFVENSRGSRFFLDSYSATWLAYSKE